ncbi:hypothetical protein FRC01_006403 [Tulasnella sp. 417]|nr:hypothetical protein FRC01_006403 [Tulasnella sp. 417]
MVRVPHVGKRWIRRCLKWTPTSRSNRRVNAAPQPATPNENEERLEKEPEKEFPDHDVASPQPKVETTPSILRIPSELVVSILELLLDDAISGMQHYDHLINVTHVNSKLRNICTHTPSLWKRVFMEDSDGSFGLATACVARSGDASLDIITHVINQVFDRTEDILQLLNYASHRIASLDITLAIHCETSWIGFITNLQDMRMPRLHTLSADVWVGELVGRVGLQPILPLPKAPNLVSLSLVSLATETGAGRLSTIRRLCLGIFTFWAQPYTTLINMLMSCEHLAELELSGTEAKRYVAAHTTDLALLPPARAIPLSKLRRVSITGVDDSLVLYLLLNIEAPQLEFVKVNSTHAPGVGPYIDWEGIADAEERRLAFPSVRTIKVLPRINQDPANRFQPVFAVFLSKAFPNVEEVEMVAMSTIFYTICGNSRRYPFWPNLSRFSVLKSDSQRSFWDCTQTLKLIHSFVQERRVLGLSGLTSVDAEICSLNLDRAALQRWFNEMDEAAGLQFVDSRPGTRAEDRVIRLGRLPDL